MANNSKGCKVIFKQILKFQVSWLNIMLLWLLVAIQEEDDWEDFSEGVDDIEQLLAPASAFPGEIM